MTLKGRSFDIQPEAVGKYERKVNGSFVYWVKEHPEFPQAIWFSQGAGSWHISNLDDIVESRAKLTSLGTPHCPYSAGLEWQYWDYSKWEPVGVEGTVQIFKSKDKKNQSYSQMNFFPTLQMTRKIIVNQIG